MLITDKKALEQFYTDKRIWQGIPSIERTKKGRTFIAFYSGSCGEFYGNYAAVLMSDTDTDFGEPVVVAYKEGDYRCFDEVLWIDPLGRLWFVWTVFPGDDVFASICEDPDADELSWSEVFYVGRGVMINKPIVTKNGDWLFPIALWKKAGMTELRKSGFRDDDVTGTYVWKSTDYGKTFSAVGYADLPDRGGDEHMLLELEDGILMMIVRALEGISVTFSSDGGKTWSEGEKYFKGNPTRFHIRRLKSGRVLMVYHDSPDKRTNLTAYLSEDDGKTYPYKLLLDDRLYISYPDATECDDGIYITYDRERGHGTGSVEKSYQYAREIITAKITEEDILNGSIVSEGSFLKNVVCKLGKLDPSVPDPYATKA